MEDYSKYLNALNMSSQADQTAAAERGIKVTEAADVGQTVRGITDPLTLGIGGAALKPVVTKGLARIGVRNAGKVVDAALEGNTRGAAKALLQPEASAPARAAGQRSLYSADEQGARSAQASALRARAAQPSPEDEDNDPVLSAARASAKAAQKSAADQLDTNIEVPASESALPDAALPAEEAAVDEIPVVGPLVGVGLALASLFTGIFAPPHAPPEQPTINPATQFGV